MKNYFFYEKNIKYFNIFYKNKKNYLFKKDKIGKESLINKIFIKDDIYNFQDSADIHSKSLTISNEIHKLNTSTKNLILDRAFNKMLSINVEEILRTAYLSDKIQSYYGLENLYICKFFNDLNLFNYLKKNNYISNKIKISKIYYFFNKCYNYIENFYFFLRLLFFPEFIFFLCRKNVSKNYKYIFNVDQEPDINDVIFPLAIKKSIKKDLLVVKDFQLRDSFIKKKDKKYPYFDLFYITNTFKNISLITYLKKFYLKYFYERMKLLILNKYKYKEIYRYFSTKICWEVFLNCYKVEKSLTAMLPSNNTSQLIQKKNIPETIFVYHSSTPNLSSEISDKSLVDAIQYNYMDYSTLITNQVSINYLNKQTNNFINYKNFGSPDSSSAVLDTNKVKLFKNNLKIIEDKKIVGIFDNSIGYKGVLSNNEYLEFLKYLNFLVTKYKNFYFILNKKDKRNYYHSNISNYKQLNSELKKIEKNKNFINFNYQLSSSQILTLSDIVITHPYSSIIYDSLCSKKITLIYDNNKNLIYSDNDYSKISNTININKIKLKYRLLDKDVIDILRLNSKKSLAMTKIGNKTNYFTEVFEYLEK